jgi:hypothetical protein
LKNEEAKDMMSGICRTVCSKTYKQFIKNRERIDQYKSNLGTWETRLNDESRMLIQSIKGSVDAEKFINKSGTINVPGFMSYVKQQYPQFYNSKNFQDYNKQVIHLQGKIRYEKQIINKYTRYYNQDVKLHPYLAKVWDFKELPYDMWNEGRDVEKVSEEYNKLNEAQF